MLTKFLAERNIRTRRLRALLGFPSRISIAIPLQGNIRTRILRAVLGVSILSLLCFALISLHGMSRLGDFAVRSSTSLGEQTCEISRSAVEEVTRASLLQIAIAEANLCNSEFRQIEATVNVLADIAEKPWNRPGSFPGNRAFAPDENPADPRLASVSHYPKKADSKRIKKDNELSPAMDTLFRSVLANNANISAINIGAPGGLFRRYPRRAGPTDHDVRKREWFQGALKRGEGGWSDPYLDPVSKSLRVNYARPVHAGDRPQAVIVVDVPLGALNERIISARLNNLGSTFLVDRRGRIIAREGSPAGGGNWADPGTVETFALDTGSANRREFEEDLFGATKGIARGFYQGRECYIAHAPIETTRWSVVFTMPVEVVNASVVPTERAITDVTSRVSVNNRRSMLFLSSAFLAAIVAVYLVARGVARFITEPILVLRDGAKVIGDGNLEHRIEVHSGDEIEALADAFNKMTENLREYIRSLTETTAAKERIQGELKVATDIQASHLPRQFPPFPSRTEFDIFAHMDPAKEVGGDFYDFFFVDEKTLCFLIADVSDKGVPAALYMMVAKTLLKTEALRGLGPDEILFRVNNLLSDNDSCMFVTVFCALLDTDSGEVRFANAGHNPPLIYRKGLGFEYLKIKAGFVLGPMAGSPYVKETITLGADDVLFLYTDGVTEAMNHAAELYGERRLLEALNRAEVFDLTTMVHAIRRKVEEHANGAPQSDDVTMLALRYRGSPADA